MWEQSCFQLSRLHPRKRCCFSYIIFFVVYEHPSNHSVDCSNYKNPPLGKVCSLPMLPKDWSPCLDKDGYGYDAGGPCIFLKLNKVNLYNNNSLLNTLFCLVRPPYPRNQSPRFHLSAVRKKSYEVTSRSETV